MLGHLHVIERGSGIPSIKATVQTTSHIQEKNDIKKNKQQRFINRADTLRILGMAAAAATPATKTTQPQIQAKGV